MNHCIQYFFSNCKIFLFNGFYLCFLKGPGEKLFKRVLFKNIFESLHTIFFYKLSELFVSWFLSLFLKGTWSSEGVNMGLNNGVNNGVSKGLNKGLNNGVSNIFRTNIPDTFFTYIDIQKWVGHWLIGLREKKQILCSKPKQMC